MPHWTHCQQLSERERRPRERATGPRCHPRHLWKPTGAPRFFKASPFGMANRAQGTLQRQSDYTLRSRGVPALSLPAGTDTRPHSRSAGRAAAGGRGRAAVAVCVRPAAEGPGPGPILGAPCTTALGLKAALRARALTGGALPPLSARSRPRPAAPLRTRGGSPPCRRRGGGQGSGVASRRRGSMEGAAAEDGGPSAPQRVLFPPTFSVSEIKNKQRRHFMFLRWKQQQRKVGQGPARPPLPGARGGGGPGGQRVWLTGRSRSPSRRSWPPRRSGGRSEKPSETK